MTVGPKTVVVEYPGDDNYTANYTISGFNVENVKVTPDIVVVDQGNGTVVVVVGDNATGNVTITVEGKNFTGEVINGTAVITVENVTPGVHDIEVIYSGDETHNNSTADATITIPKDEIKINVGAYDIYVGSTEFINVTLPNGASGNVLIEVNGRIYEPVAVDNNVVRFAVENLTAGGKTVVAYYSGDDKYVPRNVTDRFTVSKYNSTVSAEIDDVYVGENVIVNVKGIDDATGQVLIDIDGVTYYANLTNGIGSVEIPRMLNGTYPVNLTYVGDYKYLPSHNTALFHVSKVPSFVIPVAEDIYVGELENIQLSVPTDAVGNVTLVINGEEYNFNVEDGLLAAVYSEGTEYYVAVSGGNGVLVLTGLPEGEYLVSARYNGDDKYLPSVNETTFKVIKVEAPPEIIRNETEPTNTQSSESETPILVPDEPEPVNVVPLDDNDVINSEYFGNFTNKTNPVEAPVTEDPVSEPIDTPISVTPHDIYVGETETVVVTVPNDATGNVTIEIDGKKYTTTEIIDGKATFNVDGLTAGEKTVIAIYSGNDKYAANNTNGKFNVKKLPSTVNATGEDIYVGEDEIIEVDVPKDATGTVTIEIDGKKYSTTDIVDGKAKITIPELPAGDYTAKVYYSGDDKYLPSEGNLSFKVSEVESPAEDDVEEEYNETTDDDITETDDGDDISYPDSENDETHPAKKSYHEDNVGLSQYETGNPLLVLLLVLLAIGSSQIRRFK